MPKPKTVTTGRRTGHAGSKAGSMYGRQDDLPTPARKRPSTGLKLKINLSTQAAARKQGSATPPPVVSNFVGDAQDSYKEEEQAEQNVDKDLPPVQEEMESPAAKVVVETQLSRAGRVVKKRQDDAFLYGSEMDNRVDLSSMGKADNSDEAKYQGPRSLPPGIVSMQKSRGGGRKNKKGKVAPAPKQIDKEPFSETIAEFYSPSQTPPEHRRKTFIHNPDPKIYQILDILNKQPNIKINLPILGDPYTPEEELPWTGESLVQLYITAYNGGQWNTCDLVVDTWIRAFHKIRHRAEKYNDEEHPHIWRINDALVRRRRHGKEGFRDQVLNHTEYLHVEDPKLDKSAHDFDRGLLAQLYENTKPGAGARLMFADSMALCGRKLEHEMARGKRYSATWHPDLMYDMLCTTLRMVGRKLTLKIEEGTEGAWCKRYHEHSKHELPCYRKLAAEEGPVDRYGSVPQMGRGVKRGRKNADDSEESDEDENENEAKRARFASQAPEVVDVDVESESDSE